VEILYPRLSVRDLLALVATTVLGACIAGVYGALHDQISYSISPEYFTRMKFEQFGLTGLANGSPRLAAGEVGVLATWWVGAIGGWLIGRAGRPRAWRTSLRAIGVSMLVAMFAGIAGAALGTLRVRGDLASRSAWQDGLGIHDLKAFVVVAYLHDASYAGALAGIVLAIVQVRRSARSARNAAGISSQP
jgi:hypothetical protein